MMVFRGLGDRTFAPPIPVPGLAYVYGSGPRAADFNLDGFNEVLVQQKDYTYKVLVGLPPPAIIPMPEYIGAVLLLADVNDDGGPDVVSVTPGAGLKHHVVLALSGAPRCFDADASAVDEHLGL